MAPLRPPLGRTCGAASRVCSTCRDTTQPIAPGVPWTQVEGRPLLLALKSGNFGTVDFFDKALAQVGREGRPQRDGLATMAPCRAAP